MVQKALICTRYEYSTSGLCGNQIYVSISYSVTEVFLRLNTLKAILKATCYIKASLDSKVGITTGYWLDYCGVSSSSPCKFKNSLFSTSSRPNLRSIQPPIQWVTGVKWPGREADHSPPTSAEVKKMWNYTPTPPYAFMAKCLVS
jgi:hypothetical protein